MSLKDRIVAKSLSGVGLLVELGTVSLSRCGLVGIDAVPGGRFRLSKCPPGTASQPSRWTDGGWVVSVTVKPPASAHRVLGLRTVVQ